MRANSTLLVECERCGQQHSVERAGRFRDSDYIELLHDYFEMEREFRREIATLERRLQMAKFWIEHSIAAAEFDQFAEKAAERLANAEVECEF